MRNLLVLFAFLSLLFISFSCKDNDWKKSAAESVANVVSPALAVTLDCANPLAVRTAVYNKVSVWIDVEEISKPKNKAIASSLCIVAVSAVLPSLIDMGTGALPAEWGCTGTTLNTTITSFARTTCALLPY